MKLRTIRTGILIISAILVAILAAGISYLYLRTPIPNLNRFAQTQATVVYFSDGSEMGRFGSENRIEVPLQQVPEFLQHAIFAAEDERFLTQPAFSVNGIIRATWNNLRGNQLQGGSTITQQYAKVAYLNQERSFSRKIRELVIAIKLEMRYSKEEILEKYLNTIYFGRGCYGIETAAQQFFGRPARLLTPEQSIAIASMIRAPGTYNPTDADRLQYLQRRYEFVKKNMIDNGWLSPNYALGANFPIIQPPKDVTTFKGPKGYILEEVRLELTKLGFTSDQIRDGGLEIVTTINRKFQDAAEAAVQANYPSDAPKDLHIGLAAIRPGTGEVLAMYGGKDYVERQLNDATQGITQAGSTFKVFTLAAALERGIPLSSIWDGASPQVFREMGERYRVTNYGDVSFGKMSLLQATAKSVNTVFVRLGYKVGPSNSVSAALRAGIPKTVEMLPTPSFPLGVSSPHVIDVATAFATFAAQGIYSKTHIVDEVTERRSLKKIYKFQRKSERVFKADVMADLTYALRNVVTGGTASATVSRLGRPAAGKTGTSQNHASAWFSGYTPQVAASVAFFRDDSTRELVNFGGMREITGGSYPARIWTKFVADSLQGEVVKYFPRPVFIGGSRPIDLVNPSPKPSETIFKLPESELKPLKPRVIPIRPIPIPSISPKSIP